MAKKNVKKPGNPFIYKGYHSPEYFCDRTEETDEMIANMQNRRNTTLISPRRIGKTGLIQNTFFASEKQIKMLFVSILTFLPQKTNMILYSCLARL